MICKTCGSKTGHIKVVNGIEQCPFCADVLEANVKTTGKLTKMRLRADSEKFEKDIQPPYRWDKGEKKVKINEEFIKQYPHRIKDTYSKEELKKEGYGY